MKHPEMVPYLPKAINYKGEDTLKQMLSEHPKIYVKDCYGSNGKGILRVAKKEGGYEYSYVKDQRLFTKKVKSITEIITAIEQLLSNHKIILQLGHKNFT